MCDSLKFPKKKWPFFKKRDSTVGGSGGRVQLNGTGTSHGLPRLQSPSLRCFPKNPRVNFHHSRGTLAVGHPCLWTKRRVRGDPPFPGVFSVSASPVSRRPSGRFCRMASIFGEVLGLRGKWPQVGETPPAPRLQQSMGIHRERTDPFLT